jgi:uncharacterized protein with von Willebrand factor type A (vWA) domain
VRIRYSRWDGTQDPLGDDLSAGELLDAMSEDILSGGGADAALRRLIRRGMSGRISGTDALAARLREARRQEEERLDLEGPLAELADRLDDILERERTVLSFRDEDDARTREAFLDALPHDLPGRIQELRDYRFVDPEAQQKFDELMKELTDQVLGAYFRNLAQGLKDLSPDELKRMKDMLADLNAMIEARERGEHRQEDFDRFMERHGDFFPEGPRTLDELLESLARRLAAMSRLMASLPPDRRRELEELARQVLGDLDLAFETDRLASHLGSLFPGMPWDEPTLGGGDEAMPLSATLDSLERLHDFEELDRSLRGDYAGASMEDVDDDAVRRTLGDDAARDVRRLKEIERALEQAGLITRSHGRIEVTPRGARKLGERALVRVFERLRQDREGAHEAREAGGLAEPTGATRPWRFGDSGQVAVQRTVFNALVREGPGGGSVQILPDDLELVEAETRTETATALLLDLSFSMPLRGHFVPAKRMALALHALIEGRYPSDTLYLIGFSDFARQLRPEDLTASGWERVYGTNMQHAFNLAGRLLSQHPRAARQVIMVTDGEPTAHLEGEEVFFSWPPVRETIRRTLAEAMQLARAGVTLNVFMLEDSPGLAQFMERLARLTSGRVFLMSAESAGDFVLRDYVRRRAS